MVFLSNIRVISAGWICLYENVLPAFQLNSPLWAGFRLGKMKSVRLFLRGFGLVLLIRALMRSTRSGRALIALSTGLTCSTSWMVRTLPPLITKTRWVQWKRPRRCRRQTSACWFCANIRAAGGKAKGNAGNRDDGCSIHRDRFANDGIGIHQLANFSMVTPIMPSIGCSAIINYLPVLFQVYCIWGVLGAAAVGHAGHATQSTPL